MKIKPSTISKILDLRSKFQTISDISYAFSKLNKAFPIDFIGEEEGHELMKAYTDLLNKFNLNYEKNKEDQVSR